MMDTIAEVDGSEKTHIAAVNKENNRSNKNKIPGTRIKQDIAITCKPETETANEAEAASADGHARKQAQEDHKNHQPDSLGGSWRNNGRNGSFNRSKNREQNSSIQGRCIRKKKSMPTKHRRPGKKKDLKNHHKYQRNDNRRQQ